MGVPAREGAIVQAVPLARARTAAYGVLALAGFAVMAAAAGGRLSMALDFLIGGAFWAGVMIWLSGQVAGPPPPLLVAEQDLLPAAAVWRVLARDAAVYTALVTGAVFASLRLRQGFTAGFVLGVPGMSWVGQRAAERTERELDGTLWRSAGFAFRAAPVRYLSPADPEAG